MFEQIGIVTSEVQTAKFCISKFKHNRISSLMKRVNIAEDHLCQQKIQFKCFNYQTTCKGYGDNIKHFESGAPNYRFNALKKKTPMSSELQQLTKHEDSSLKIENHAKTSSIIEKESQADDNVGPNESHHMIINNSSSPMKSQLKYPTIPNDTSKKKKKKKKHKRKSSKEAKSEERRRKSKQIKSSERKKRKKLSSRPPLKSSKRRKKHNYTIERKHKYNLTNEHDKKNQTPCCSIERDTDESQSKGERNRTENMDSKYETKQKKSKRRSSANLKSTCKFSPEKKVGKCIDSMLSRNNKPHARLCLEYIDDDDDDDDNDFGDKKFDKIPDSKPSNPGILPELTKVDVNSSTENKGILLQSQNGNCNSKSSSPLSYLRSSAQRSTKQDIKTSDNDEKFVVSLSKMKQGFRFTEITRSPKQLVANDPEDNSKILSSIQKLISDSLLKQSSLVHDYERSISERSNSSIRSRSKSSSYHLDRSRSRTSYRSSCRKHKRRCSSSFSSSSSSTKVSRSSRSRSYSSSTANDRRSRSRSNNRSYRSYSSCSSSTSKSSRSRSVSIPRRRGSPSFLERRRITSARKRPIPYQRSSVLCSPSSFSESSYLSSSSESIRSSPRKRAKRSNSSWSSRYGSRSRGSGRRRSSSYYSPSSSNEL